MPACGLFGGKSDVVDLDEEGLRLNKFSDVFGTLTADDFSDHFSDCSVTWEIGLLPTTDADRCVACEVGARVGRGRLR
ncbi:MAG: hypothetical protein ACJATT_005862 [Myxococcota bacterium]|jgi:hypothetical protein